MNPGLSAPDAVLWALVALRVLPFCLLLSMVAFRRPRYLASLGVAGLLAACLWTYSQPAAGTVPVRLTVLAGVRELVVGTGFAVAAGGPLLAMRWAGGFIDQTGGGARMPRFDSAAVGRLFGWLALAAFFGLGGHRLTLQAFVRTLRTLPISPPSGPPLGLTVVRQLAEVLGAALGWALTWAAPIIVVVVLVDLALSAIQRFARQLPLQFVLAPARTLVWLSMVLATGVLVLEALPSALVTAASAAASIFGG